MGVPTLTARMPQYVEQKTGQIEKLLAHLEACNALGKKNGQEIKILEQELARIKIRLGQPAGA